MKCMINCCYQTKPFHWSSSYSRQYSLLLPGSSYGSNFVLRNNFNLMPLNNPVIRPTKASICTSSSSVVLLAVNSPATTGDLSVLIPTSAAFLFLYWIANFVVPEFVVKDLESQDASIDRSQNEKESISLSGTTNSEPKKRGF